MHIKHFNIFISQSYIIFERFYFLNKTSLIYKKHKVSHKESVYNKTWDGPSILKWSVSNILTKITTRKLMVPLLLQMIPRKPSSLVLVSTLLLSVVNATVPGSASANEINQTQKKRSAYVGGALYPQATETRDLRTLDGIWNFRKSPTDPEYGYRNGWYEQDLMKVILKQI